LAEVVEGRRLTKENMEQPKRNRNNNLNKMSERVC
jgi:hypothetical protein